MFKTLLASTAIATALAAGAFAQDTTQPDATPPAVMEPAAPGTAADPATPLAPNDPALAQNLMPYTGELSADTLIGASIQQADGQKVADINDVILSPDGVVESVVAQFGGFLGFGSNTVLLSMDEITPMQDEAGNLVVQTHLTPEALEGRPDYQAEN